MTKRTFEEQTEKWIELDNAHCNGERERASRRSSGMRCMKTRKLHRAVLLLSMSSNLISTAYWILRTVALFHGHSMGEYGGRE